MEETPDDMSEQVRQGESQCFEVALRNEDCDSDKLEIQMDQSVNPSEDTVQRFDHMADELEPWMHVTLTAMDEIRLSNVDGHQAIGSRNNAVKQNAIRRLQILEKMSIRLFETTSDETWRFEEFESRLKDLRVLYELLCSKISDHEMKRQQEHDFQHYVNFCEKGLLWICENCDVFLTNDAVSIVNHLEEFQQGLEMLNVKMQNIEANELSRLRKLEDDLTAQEHPQIDEIRSKSIEVTNKWEDLKNMVMQQQETYKAAVKVREFLKDVDAFKANVSTAEVSVCSNDFGKDEKSILAQLNRHVEVEASFDGMRLALDSVCTEQSRLCEEAIAFSQMLKEETELAEQKYEKLRQTVKCQKAKLQSTLDLLKFLRTYNGLMNPLRTIKNKVSAEVAALKSLALRQEEQCDEILALQENFKRVKECSQQFMESSNIKVVEQKMSDTEKLESDLTKLLEERNQLCQRYTVAEFLHRSVKSLENYVAAEEVFLQNDKFGEDMESVQLSVENEEFCQKGLFLQQEQLIGLEELASSLKGSSVGSIHERLAKLKGMIPLLLEKSAQRRAAMDISVRMLEFDQRCNECMERITDTLKAAENMEVNETSDNTDDECAISSKVFWKTTIFTDETQSIGKSLMESFPQHEDIISAKLTEISDLFRKLDKIVEGLGLTRRKLGQRTSEFEDWLTDMESHLSVNPITTDLETVKVSMRQLEQWDTEVKEDCNNIDKIKQILEHLPLTSDFKQDEVQRKISTLEERYQLLTENLQTRTKILSDSFGVHHLLKEIDENEIWIAEMLQSLEANNSWGEDLHAAQEFTQKNHDLVKNNDKRMGSIDSLKTRCKELGGNRTQELVSRLEIITKDLQLLHDKLTTRKEDLAKALLVTLLVFFVPCDSGEKVTLGISALLSMTVFLMTIRESLPPTEKTPLISFYYGVSICIVTFASAMAVVTLNIHHRGFRGVTVPGYLRFVCLKIIGRILLVQGEPDIGQSSSSSERHDAQLDAFRELRVQLNGLHPTMGHRLDSRSASRKYDYTDLIQRSPRFEPKLAVSTTAVGGGGSGGGGGGGTSSTLVGPASTSTLSAEDFNSKFGRIASKICETIERCEMRTAEQTKHDANQLEWKKVALVCDRFLFWGFAISTAISTTLILFSSPYGPSLHDLKHIFGFEVDYGNSTESSNGVSETPAITHETSADGNQL